MGRHRWEITLREFVNLARQYYGVEIRMARIQATSGWYLTRGEESYPLIGFKEDDILPLGVLRNLCRAFRLPPLDFGLDPED